MILENSIVFSRRLTYPSPNDPIPSEYLIYDASESFGRVITIFLPINEIYADTISVDFQLTDSTTITKSFDNTVKEKTFCFDQAVTHIHMYYEEISPLNTLRKIDDVWLGRQIELHLIYNGCAESALQKERTARGNVSRDIVFVPYHQGIKRCELLVRSHGSTYTTGYVYITDRLGIRRMSNLFVIYHNDRSFTISNWGLIAIYNPDGLINVPTGTVIELLLEMRMDNAASAMGLYTIDNVLIDRWFPSHNGCFPLVWPVNSSSNITLVDDKDNLISGNPDPFTYVGQLYLNQFISDTSNVISTVNLTTMFQSAISKGVRIGLLISPTTVPTSDSTINKKDNSTNTYYTIPTWMLNALKNSSYTSDEGPALYRVSKTDTYNSSNNIYVYYLNWKNPTVKQLYKDCIDILYTYLSTAVISGKQIYNYIDYIKVAFAGTWGEGLTLDIDGTGVPDPWYCDLNEISDYIKDKFSNKISLCPLGTAMNMEFPLGYRDSFMNGGNGLFFDGVSNMSRYFYLRGNYPANDHGKLLSAATADLINNASVYAKDHTIYLECEQYVTDSVKPSYADLEVYAKCFSPDYLNLRNIFQSGIITASNIQQKDNLRNTLMRISHYVGTRPYILINETRSAGTKLTVKFSIGNYGTAKFREYWDLKLYAKNGITEQLLTMTNFSLQNVPAPFEPGVPNFYDTIVFSQEYNLSFTPTEVLIAIEDSEEIYENMPFCNTTDSLPREQGTGRYYLLGSVILPV